jgi:hypothetical protein
MPGYRWMRSAFATSIALCALALVTGARADGDPASDTLYL